MVVIKKIGIRMVGSPLKHDGQGTIEDPNGMDHCLRGDCWMCEQN